MFMYTDVCTKNVKNTWKGARKTEEECGRGQDKEGGRRGGRKGGAEGTIPYALRLASGISNCVNVSPIQ